nr:hypothetical protein [Allomuricauda sp.]
MKQMFLILACFFALSAVQAQENYVDQVQVGDLLVFGEPAGTHYKFVDVPRKNFIIKRGGIADLSTLYNVSLTITDITYGKEPEVTFKRTDGKKFFRVYKSLSAQFNKAVEEGELKIPQERGRASIVR